MKKRMIGMGVACLTACTLLTGCGASNSPPETTTAETTTVAETTTTTAETTTVETTTTTEAPTTTLEARANTELYNEVINAYYLAQQTQCPSWYQLPEGINDLFPEYSEHSKGVGNDFITSVCDTSPSYYAIHDFDRNGVEELAIFNGEGLSALYTISGDEVIPLAFGQSRNMLKISDEGDVYLWSHGGWQDYQIYKFKFSDDGNSLQVVYYKGIDGNNPDGSITYYSCPSIAGESFFDLEIGETEKISEEELRKAEEEYKNAECTLEKLPLQAFPLGTETFETTNDENNHQGNSAFTEYLRKNFDRDKGSYSKYAIADFDADGVDELALERKGGDIEIIDEGDLSLQYDDYTYINDYTFDSITFLDNGVAYVKKDFYLDSKDYFLINREWLSELGYNPGESGTFLEREIYYIEEYAIFKTFMSGDYMVNTKGYKNSNEIITQEEYEKESQMLNSGNVLDFQVKDFTAENLGL